MKTKKKKNKKFFIPLLVTVIVVWGLLIFRVVSTLTHNNNETITNETSTDTSFNSLLEAGRKKEKINLQYEKLDRDPFRKYQSSSPKIVATQKSRPKEVFPKEIKKKIQYSINGVIIRPNKKMIVLEDKTNNKTLFLHEGETYKDITIKIITSNKVTYLHDKELKEITIK